MTDLKISIALATCQSERFLAEQLASIKSQTHCPFELVVGDDCSTDGTMRILEEFARDVRFPIRIKQNDRRLGYRVNFMETAMRCQGDLIAFCDHDDVWHKEKLARSSVPFSRSDVVLVCHDANVVDTNARSTGKRLSKFRGRASKPSMRPLHLENGMTITFRQSLLEYYDLWTRSIDVFDLSQPAAHDQWFYFLASVLGQVVHLSDCLADYRQHDGNVSGVPFPKIDVTRLQRQKYYETCAVAVLKRIEILRALHKRGALRGECGIDELLPYYRHALSLYEARANIYSAGPRLNRLEALYNVFRLGGYTPSEFGRTTAIASDIILGLVGIIPSARLSDWYRSQYIKSR